MALKVMICTDALIAPINDLGALCLKIDLPCGGQWCSGISVHHIDAAVAHVRDRFGLDVRPLILAEIERHRDSDHPYRLRMPAELLAMVEPMAIAAE